MIENTHKVSSKLKKKEEDYSAWFNGIIQHAGLAEISPVRGCMILKPYGYAIWENIKNILDGMFKDTGHENAYFPLFIPKSYLSREASHVEGFAKECAVVTHYRLKEDPVSKKVIVDEDAKLEEELIVRPTSETIIWDSYKRWIQSYRDLPLLINQWANVVRWEMRTRMFLRTAEILWQEGHTAHATREEAQEETITMLNVYSTLLEDYLSIPPIKGVKTENEKFAGAEQTYTVETMTLDKRALQAGTSHFLGTNFSRAFDVKFATKEGKLEYVWGSSWGVTTRLIGSLIMSHSDNSGLVLPPKVAPIQVVLIPIYRGREQQEVIVTKLQEIAQKLKSENIKIKLDDNDQNKPGWKFSEYEMKGVPIRLSVGPKDLENRTIEVYRRDTSEKKFIPIDDIIDHVKAELDNIQTSLLERALHYREENTHKVDSYDEFKLTLKEKRGFILAHWDGTPETELKIKEETKASIRCIPLGDDNPEKGACIYSGKPSVGRVVFAEAY